LSSICSLFSCIIRLSSSFDSKLLVVNSSPELDEDVSAELDEDVSAELDKEVSAELDEEGNLLFSAFSCILFEDDNEDDNEDVSLAIDEEVTEDELILSGVELVLLSKAGKNSIGLLSVKTCKVPSNFLLL
jgi:hypothetical protein